MDGLHCEGDDDAGEEAGEFVRSWRWIVRGCRAQADDRACRLDVGLPAEMLGSSRQASAAKDAETGTGGGSARNTAARSCLVGSSACAVATIRTGRGVFFCAPARAPGCGDAP